MRPLLLSLGLLAALYVPKLGIPLVWDDRPTIVFNSALDRPIPLSRYFSPDYFNFAGEATWRPLATLSYQAMVQAAGKSPGPLRAIGFLIHLLNGFLLVVVLEGAGVERPVRLLASALFLLHPAHTETLMCVSFNEELLCSLGLLSMLAFHQRRRWGLAALAFAAALLSKEPGVFGLPIVILYDRLERRTKAWGAYAAYGMALGLYLWIRFFPMRGPGGDADLSHLLPATERLFYGAQGFVSACRIFFLPIFLRIEYFAVPPDSGLEAAAWVSVCAACLGLILLALRRSARREGVVFLFLLWPLAFLSLTSNILPVGVLSTRYMAERWLYLPYIGASVVLARPLSRRPWLAAAVLCLWGAIGWRRLRDWTPENRLWESLALVYPWSSKAHEGAGEALFHAERFPQALAEFETALRTRRTREDLVLSRYVPLAPPGTIGWESPSLYRWLGLSHLELHADQRASEMFEKANGLDPADGFTYRALSYLEARGGRFDKARKWLEAGLRKNPGDVFLLRLEPDIAARRLSFQAKFQ